VRLRLYNSGASDATVATALAQLRRGNPTPIAAKALTLVEQEYGLGQ
jgi:predicted kinase